MFHISKKYEQIPKTIRIPSNLAEKLENTAHENNISFNCLVIQCIEYAFNNIYEDNGNTTTNNKKESENEKIS